MLLILLHSHSGSPVLLSLAVAERQAEKKRFRWMCGGYILKPTPFYCRGMLYALTQTPFYMGDGGDKRPCFHLFLSFQPTHICSETMVLIMKRTWKIEVPYLGWQAIEMGFQCKHCRNCFWDWKGRTRKKEFAGWLACSFVPWSKQTF